MIFANTLLGLQHRAWGALPQFANRYGNKTPIFRLPPSCRTTVKRSGGSETKRGLRRISGVGSHGVSQEPIAKSPAWCGALSA